MQQQLLAAVNGAIYWRGGGGNPNKQTKKNKIQTYKIRKDSFQLDL